MKIQQALDRLVNGGDLSADEMQIIMRQVMTGDATPAQIGGFLVALRMKGETVDEVAAAAAVMRNLAEGVALQFDDAIDIVGTGGDASSTFNVSTCCAVVAAAAGASVAKHGNRSVSSQSGAADLLEAAGVNINLSPDQVSHCVSAIKLGFMFAPLHHSAMKHAIGPRKEMAIRTIFNLLGPLTNPAGIRRQLLGVYAPEWVMPIAQVLKKLGSEHVMVVHGHDGMDEISISGPTHIAELRNGVVTEFVIEPAHFGLKNSALSEIQVQGAAQSLAMIQSVFENEASAARDIVMLNTGAALCVAGLAATISQGVGQAETVLASGAAKAKFAEIIQVSQSFNRE